MHTGAFLLLFSLELALNDGLDVSNPKQTHFFYGDKKASAGEFPYVVALSYPLKYKPTNYYKCGGCLISKTRVLTTPYCFLDEHPMKPENIRLAAGCMLRLEIDALIPPPHCQIRFGKDVRLHDKYNMDDVTHNLALITVDEPFNFTTTVNRAIISTDDLQEATDCSIAGFGRTFAAPPQEYLTYAAPLTVTRECPDVIKGNSLCTSGGKAGLCKYDYGCPLICSGLVVGLSSLVISEEGVVDPCGKTKVESFVSLYGEDAFLRDANPATKTYILHSLVISQYQENNGRNCISYQNKRNVTMKLEAIRRIAGEKFISSTEFEVTEEAGISSEQVRESSGPGDYAEGSTSSTKNQP